MNVRLRNLLAGLALFIAAVGLYFVKYWVQDVKEDVVQLEQHLAEEKESLHLLQAEWAYLNRPERLQQLSQEHLALQPIGAAQVVRYEGLPERELITAGKAQHEKPMLTPAGIER